MLHESTFHSAFEIFNLKISTTLWNQLMFDYTVRVFLSLLVTFVKMVERKRSTVRCLGHYNYLWWNGWNFKKLILKMKLLDLPYSIINFLFLTIWTKNQPFPTAKFMICISQPQERVSSKDIHNITNRNFVFSILCLFSTFASVVLIVFFVVNVWQKEIIFNMI